MTQKIKAPQNTRPHAAREFLGRCVARAKSLHGDPHYIAMGMGIGIFVSATPFFPFHTSIAVALSLLFKGSKSAAAIGVWLSNPLTLPFFYLASYKTGAICLGNDKQIQIDFQTFSQILDVGKDITIAMIVGGVLIGILLGPIAYYATHRFFSNLRQRRAAASHDNAGC